MKNKRNADLILWVEAIGFSLIITLSWLDELIGLPRILFNDRPVSNWHEAAIETVVVLLVWVVVHFLTRSLLKRLHHLEDFLKICAWCRRIAKDEEWLPMEEYFHQEFDAMTTHGMCPDCFKKLEEKIKPENQI